jgi:hypothetical protein
MPKDIGPLAQTPLGRGPITVAGLDVPYHAAIARMNCGLSPTALGQAWADWVQHLWLSPDIARRTLQNFGSAVAPFPVLLRSRL